MAKVRVNFQMDEELKEWAQNYADVLGISLSAFLNLTVSQYRQQMESIKAMSNMSELVGKIEELQKSLAKDK